MTLFGKQRPLFGRRGGPLTGRLCGCQKTRGIESPESVTEGLPLYQEAIEEGLKIKNLLVRQRDASHHRVDVTEVRFHFVAFTRDVFERTGGIV